MRPVSVLFFWLLGCLADHWNHINTTFYNDTVRAQGIDPAAHPDLPDPFTHRVFGGSVTGTSLTAVSGSGNLQLHTSSAASPNTIEVQVKLLTIANTTPTGWLHAMSQLVASAGGKSTSPMDCMRGPSVAWLARVGCAAAWREITERSYIQVTDRGSAGGARTADKSARTAAENITTHAAWDRYLSIIQGRRAYAPIKFNGQDFLSNQAGHGFDYRVWGEAYWWQGTRHPYYNCLDAGDVDTLRSMLDFYARMLPYVQARSAAQFKGTSVGGVLSDGGALFEETTTQFGMYQESNWGCNASADRTSVHTRPDGASGNRFIRFHFTGSR